jgi:hypothetical protein
VEAAERRDRVARHRQGEAERISSRAVGRGQLGLLDERVDSHRVGRVAVVDRDRQAAAAQLHPCPQRAPVGVGCGQARVAQRLAAPGERDAAPNQAGPQAARDRQRQGERATAGARTRPHVEAVLEPGRPVRPPLVGVAVPVVDAVSRRTRGDGPYRAQGARSAVADQAQPGALGARDDGRAGR